MTSDDIAYRGGRGPPGPGGRLGISGLPFDVDALAGAAAAGVLARVTSSAPSANGAFRISVPRVLDEPMATS